MADARAIPQPLAARTAWTRNLAEPVREFMRTESGGAIAVVVATLAALVWANVDSGSYESVWTTELTFGLGDDQLALDLRHWVNDGLMAFFFLVIGLEARREFDLGELRERRRITLPLLAAAGGMALPVLVYLALNAGEETASGWGAAMATDTAFALGGLAVIARGASQRLRVFLLTLVVAEDLVALVVIGVAYSEDVVPGALAIAAVLFALLHGLRRLEVGRLPQYLVGVATWVALFESGIHPTVAGLAIGLTTAAYPTPRSELERVTALVRRFREQPTPELARSARLGVQAAISPNERLQHALHPWTSFLIVPLFALANAGIPLDGGLLSRAAGSPVTLGIVIGYAVAKPLGIVGTSWLVTTVQAGRRRPPVGWGALLGGSASASIGFTVSLLIASLAFSGEHLEEAKLGVLGSVIAGPALGWLIFRAIALLPPSRRARQLMGAGEDLVDLFAPVDPDRDHIRGPATARVTLVEYGDFECANCGQAEPVVRQLLSDFGDDLRYVFRHLPLADVHPRAQMAAEASEAAAAQGRFWELYEVLFAHQDALERRQLVNYGERLGLDVDRFSHELRRRVWAPRVAEDVADADACGVTGTPTFFVNGRRHHGAYDPATLTRAVARARERALVGS